MAREAQGSKVAAERAALRRDLELLLRERGTLDSLRRLVASTAVGPVAATAQQQQVGEGVLKAPGW